MFKKFTLLGAVFLMLLETPGYAENVNSEHKKSDVIYKRPAFELGLTALYLQAYSARLPTNKNSSSNDNTPNLSNKSLQAPWDWAGILEGRYYLADKNDLSLSWMHYVLDFKGVKFDHAFFSFPGEDDTLVLGQNFTTSKTTGTLHLDSVNAEFSHAIDLSSRGSARLSGGVQYLNVSDKLNQSFDVLSSDTTPSSDSLLTTFATKDKYQGVGPRIGVDVNYKLKGNFSVFAHSAATVLLARHTQSSSSIFSVASGHPPATIRTGSVYRDIAVPEIEAKLGVTFIKPTDHGELLFSTGWSVVNYFSLLDKSDLTLSGPFLQGKWVG